MTNKEIVKKFLLKHKQHESNVDQLLFIKNFQKEMNKGLKKDDELFAMVPSYLTNNLTPKINSKKVLVLDAGGTNFRVGLAEYKNGKPVFSKVEKTPIPGLKSPISKEKFYSEIATKCSKHLKGISNAGYCFSYAIKIGKNLDGPVIRMSKNIVIKGIEETCVGKETLNHFKKYNSNVEKIALFNDTIATLYGGISDINKKANYVGYILGTGTNIAYFEKPKNIKKISIKNEEYISINIESAYFDKFEMGTFEKSFINKDGNTSVLEKCTSGVYFNNIILNCLAEAKKEGLVSYELKSDFELADFSLFLNGEKTNLKKFICSKKDQEITKIILEEMIKRNAKLGSSAIAASILKNVDKKLPTYVIAEGSTFKKLPYYEKWFKYYLNNLLKKYSLSAKVYTSDNLTLKGSLLIASNL